MIISKIYHHPYHAKANSPVASPAPEARSSLFLGFFEIRLSKNNHVISKGKRILYASVSENPAGVLPKRTGCNARRIAAVAPVTFPPILLPKKKQGIIASMDINIGTKKADESSELFPKMLEI